MFREYFKKVIKNPIFLLFALALFLRLIFIDISYFIWDETVYLLDGKYFAGEIVGYNEVFMRPPILSLMLSGIWMTFPAFYGFLSKFMMAFINSLVVIPMFYLGRLVNKKVAVISALIIAILPISIINSRYILTDHLGMIFALTTILLFHLNKKKTIYFAGFFLALAVLTKFTNLLLLVMLIPMFIILIRKKRFYDLIISGVVFFLTMLPFLIYSMLKFGNPIYVFVKAFGVVLKTNQIDFGLIIFILKDIFGLMLLFLISVGLILIFMKVKKGKFTNEYLFLYYFFVTLFYFIYIIQKDIAIPKGIEWEVGRFLLLFVPFAIIFASIGILKVASLSKGRSKTISIVIIFIVSFIFLYPQFIRSYEPQIYYEDGLREISKGMGEFLIDSKEETFACLGNCPPIAYYSEKKFNMFYNKENLLNSDSNNIIIFEKLEDNNVSFKNSICKKEKCVYFYKKI